MGLLRNAIRSGIAVKVIQVAQREARKPENQRKIREFVGRLTGDGRSRPRP